jgi:hypothetical protein
MQTHQSSNRKRRTPVVGALVGVALGLPALAAFDHTRAATPAAEVSTALLRPDTGATWRATLLPPADARQSGGTTVGGVATLAPAGEKQTRVQIHVTGAKPGSTHPWHVHRGTCGKDQGIVGPANAYTPIKIGADGEGEVAQALPFPTPTSGDYMVNVHQSSSDLKTIVACGNLARG